ncbi:SurA N-terminal domain-containing protein [Caminibacter sp.]
MKKSLLILCTALILNAKIVDKVVASVNNAPITSYDIEKVSSEAKVSEDIALNMLIDQKLLQQEIKKRGITVDEFDIDNKLEKIARQNGMSLFEFKNILAQKGMLEDFKKRIKDNLLKEKLFENIVNSKLQISPEEIKNYYENHKNEFTTFKTVQVMKYQANNPKILKEVQKNPLYSNTSVKSESAVYDVDELPLRLLFLFNETKVGEFTPIINEGTHYSTYYIARKDGKKILPFKKVKNIIYNKLIAQKREEILKDYFNKIKNQADIKIYKD